MILKIIFVGFLRIDQVFSCCQNVFFGRDDGEERTFQIACATGRALDKNEIDPGNNLETLDTL